MMTATAYVSKSAIARNVRLISQRVSPAQLLAVVKDDGYGHGLETVVDVMLSEGVTRFGTLELDGAFKVRRRTPDATVFAWVFDSGDDLAPAITADIDLGVTDAAILERVADAATGAGRPAKVHLKLDTGLHRAGALPGQWQAFVARAAELERSGTVKVVGLWTHLAEASDDDDSRSIAEFTSAVDAAASAGIRNVVRHVAASAAAYSRDDARFDMVRVGAFLYGIAPGSGIGPADLGLRPVMTLKTPVVSVRADGSRAVAELPIGSAAGILQDAAGNVSVAISGRRYPVLSVEPLRALVDVTAGGIREHDTATLFGDGASGEATLQEWADGMGTIGEELVTRLAAWIPRQVIE
jgi:alanine racemase